MSWAVLAGVVGVLALALLVAMARNAELARMRERVATRDRAVRHGADRALLQHPVVDLSRCLGCGTCVAVCPEDGVLDLVHGQAMVVRGARCQGISACERECPVGAITVTMADVAERDDVPAIDEALEAIGAPGVFLAGEVTAHALIKTAIDQGTAVAAEVARRVVEANGTNGSGVDRLDLCIVGAGPAGLACSLEAKRNGLSFVTIDQELGPGGTVAKYPRRKLVMTQPVDLPLYGQMNRKSYTKEELLDLWGSIVDQEQLPIQGGEVFQGLEREADGGFQIRTQSGSWRARYVCLALGRRGTPRKLGVPGEALSKVAYGLMDARSYQGRRILVVGGGDTAIEAAMGLAEQPGNQVTISYRRDEFFRIRSENEKRLHAALEQRRLDVIHGSSVTAIHPDAVELEVAQPTGAARVTLPNDDVFVMAGGVPSFEPLQHAGVSFDAALREAPRPILEQGTGLVRALKIGLGLALAALIWALWHVDYYALPAESRPAHEKHGLLRPGMGAGLALGIGACALIVANLFYLVRRSPRVRFDLGSLQSWMTSHVATGILAFLCATLHAAMAPGDTVGGHAWAALLVLLVTGAIGRYFYAYVPRAANGRELELAEVKTRLGRIAEEWDQGQRRFREKAREQVTELVAAKQWRSSFPARVLALLGVRRDLGHLLRRLTEDGRAEGVDELQIQETLQLARRAHRTALMAAHYEDLRAVLSTWRWLHRWVAALLVLLVVVHVVYALAYGAHFFGGGAG